MREITMETVEFSVQDSVAIIRLNRPESMNAVNLQMMQDLEECQKKILDDNSIRALLMTGNGKGFCVGADIKALMGAKTPSAGVEELLNFGKQSFMTSLNMPVPVVSAINGVAAGGGVGMALSADVVVAARSASFVQTFGPKLALVPDYCASWFYTQVLGAGRALPLMLLGDKLGAEQAAEWGLVWKTVDDENLFEEAMKIAKQLAEGPSESYRRIRQQVRQAQFNNLEQQYDLEAKNNTELSAQEDFVEGITAFLEKRKPKFSPR